VVILVLEVLVVLAVQVPLVELEALVPVQVRQDILAELPV
jgi:hypothetical protein